jgi:hypothetical protein
LYSGCSEKEKENYEVSEKIIRRESSKRKDYHGNVEIRRKSHLEDDADGNRDSVISRNDSDELKIQLDQRPSPSVPPKPKKPEIPPKPKMKVTCNTDGIRTLVNPLTPLVFIECKTRDKETKDKNKMESIQSKNNISRERTLLRKPPVPERKGKAARKSSTDTLRKPEAPRRVGKAAQNEPCIFNRMNKPPIPKKPEGLVIHRSKRQQNNEVDSDKPSTCAYRSGRKLDVCCAPRKGCEAGV